MAEIDMKEKLVELLGANTCKCDYCEDCEYCKDEDACIAYLKNSMADYLVAHGVTVQECAYWQYIDDDVDEDNNIQAYCSVCQAGDKHATSMIGKVPYCWKCGRKMMPQPPKGE